MKSRLSVFSIFSILLTIFVLVTGLFPYPQVSETLVIFIGRFHPLIVHMPIGFITAVFLLQLLALVSKTNLRPGILLLLWFTMMSAVLAAAIGTLLGIPGGYEERLLQQHRWLGVGTCVICIWMLAAYRSKRTGSGLVYCVCLLLCMALVGATGHWGGSLTHGEDYLTAYLPEALGGETPPEPVDAGTKEDAAMFARVILPVFEAKCLSCHNPAKQNGDLTMESIASLLKGGKHGPAIEVGQGFQSLIVQRALLPLDDKKHMPPKGKPQLNEVELELIQWWINQGATDRMSLLADLPEDRVVQQLEKALGFAVAPPKLEMLPWEDVVTLSKTLPDDLRFRVRRLSLESPALDVQIAPGTNAVDDLIRALLPLKGNIVGLDLGGCTFSTDSLTAIGGFQNLESLRLNDTAVDDAGLEQLLELRHLTSLVLYGTEVSDAGLDLLKGLPALQKVNLWKTSVSYDASTEFVAAKENRSKQEKLQREILEMEAEIRELHVHVVGIEKPQMFGVSPELFDSNAKKYGAVFSEQAQLSVSSVTAHAPPENLQGLVKPNKTQPAFAFHTQEEPHPWVRFRYEEAKTLTALHIENRPDLPQRSEGLVLQRSDRASPDLNLDIPHLTDTTLRDYPFGQALKGRYVVIRLRSSGTCNPGGRELLLGHRNHQTYRDTVLSLGPLAYYPFDLDPTAPAEASLNLGSKSNLTARLSAGARFSGESGGLLGGCLEIDSGSKQVLLVDNGGIDLEKEWTVSAWFYDLHDKETYRTLTRATEGGDHQLIVKQGSDDLGLWNSNLKGVDLPSGFQASGFDLPAGDKTWHHIAAVGTGGDEGKTDYYLDGVLVGTADQGSSGNIYAIGNFQNGGQAFAQALDEFAVFGRALSPEQIASLAQLTDGPTVMLPDPVSATASSEFDRAYAVGNLFDGNVTLDDLGKTDRQGRGYAGKGPAPHVVVYDMGESVSFDRFFYAQRPNNKCDFVENMEIWVSEEDPGAASLNMPIFAGEGWENVWEFEGMPKAWSVELTELPPEERTARDFRLVIPEEAAILHLKSVHMWGTSKPKMIPISTLDQKKGQYGERISTQATVSLSSDTEYTPENGLKSLTQDQDNGLTFAFHTDHEGSPWVQFAYPQSATLHAINIVNRKDLPERAVGLVLESSQKGHEWDEIWKADSVEKEWTLDLSKIPVKNRSAKFFRLRLEGMATLHLSQVRMWGTLTPAPAAKAPAKN